MANHKSAEKAIRQTARRTEINKSARTRLKSSVKKVEDAIKLGNKALAAEALKDAQPIMMSTAQKGIIHKNAASRKVSRLAARVKKLGA
jgi:small subunit ribosomal protein S20